MKNDNLGILLPRLTTLIRDRVQTAKKTQEIRKRKVVYYKEKITHFEYNKNISSMESRFEQITKE